MIPSGQNVRHVILQICHYWLPSKSMICYSVDDEDQANQHPADGSNGMAEKSGNDALEAFLDSAPDPFKARQPSVSSKVNMFIFLGSYCLGEECPTKEQL